MTARDLYQDMILAHNKNPRNFKKLEDATHVAHGVNPLCGDDFYIFLKLSKDGVIQDIGFDGSGCAISKSSASMLTQAVMGKKIDEASILKDGFIEMVTQDSCPEHTKSSLGKLAIFEGVKEYPIRVKCATLIWRALESALGSDPNTVIDVSTE